MTLLPAMLGGGQLSEERGACAEPRDCEKGQLGRPGKVGKAERNSGSRDSVTEAAVGTSNGAEPRQDAPSWASPHDHGAAVAFLSRVSPPLCAWRQKIPAHCFPAC